MGVRPEVARVPARRSRESSPTHRAWIGVPFHRRSAAPPAAPPPRSSHDATQREATPVVNGKLRTGNPRFGRTSPNIPPPLGSPSNSNNWRHHGDCHSEPDGTDTTADADDPNSTALCGRFCVRDLDFMAEDLRLDDEVGCRFFELAGKEACSFQTSMPANSEKPNTRPRSEAQPSS